MKHLLNFIDYGESPLATLWAFPLRAATVVPATGLIAIMSVSGLLLILPYVYLVQRYHPIDPMNLSLESFTGTLLTHAVIVAAFLALPAIYVFFRFYLLSFFVVDKDVNGFVGLYRCWKHSAGYLPLIAVIWNLQILLVIVGVVMLGIGVLYTAPLALCLLAMTYRTMQPKSI
jgi:hypothetical protein